MFSNIVQLLALEGIDCVVPGEVSLRGRESRPQMTKLMFVLLTVLALQITACGKEFSIPQVPSAGGQQKPNDAAGGSSDNTGGTFTTNNVSGDNDVDTFQLTYYKYTATRAPQPGWATKTYAATGYCVEYNGLTYCWDDGVKILQWTDFSGNHYGPFGYSYWNLKQKANGSFSISGGGLSIAADDFMINPRTMSNTVTINVPTGSVSEVMTVGTATTVTCSEADGIVSCGDFTIDTNQSAL